jgi:hypothetical protein
MSFKEIHHALRVLHGDPDEEFLFEIRAPKHPNKKSPDRPFTKMGWFLNNEDGLLNAADAIWELNRQAVVPAIYTTLNPVADLDRFTVREKIGWQKGSTEDEDIRYRRWLLIDVDPERPTGVSATDGEKAAAFEVLERVRTGLRELGFPEPVVGDSGNGGHLLCSIRFPNTDEVTRRIEFFLKVLDHEFSNEAASIDTVVWNPARISKLYGTMSRKGDDTKERPHRQSKLIEVPERIEPVDPALFKTLTDPAFRVTPRRAMACRPSSGGSRHLRPGKRFDVRDLLNRARIGYRVAHKSSATLYHLDECPIDNSHEKGTTDTTVFEGVSGKLGFRCLHNRCQGHGWRSCRKRLEAIAG